MSLLWAAGFQPARGPKVRLLPAAKRQFER
jgi:hypothetical protein